MLSAQDLRRILPGLPRIAIRGPWYRAVAFDYLLGPPLGAPRGSPVQPLWPGGAQRRGARFTPKQTRLTAKGIGTASFGSLYLAQDEMTALLEVTGVLRPPGSPVALVFEPQVLMTVDGVLSDILDVTDGQVQSSLGTTLQELTGDWVIQQADYLAGRGPMPPTQILGQATYDVAGIAGLKYTSSKGTASGVGIVVFPNRLILGQSYIEVFNKASGVLRQRLP